MIRKAGQADSAAIAEIYNYYIINAFSTFEETPVSAAEMSNRIDNVSSLGLPWLVAESDGMVAGYAYATKWKERSAYRYSVEITVYLSQHMHGKGLGTKLYKALFHLLRGSGIHTVIGGITLPNPASISLHETLGMKKVAHFENIGFKFNQWCDVGYWQMDLQA